MFRERPCYLRQRAAGRPNCPVAVHAELRRPPATLLPRRTSLKRRCLGFWTEGGPRGRPVFGPAPPARGLVQNARRRCVGVIFTPVPPVHL